MNKDSVYTKLRGKLEATPTGVPKGEKFLEILKILFTPEEAELALTVPFMPASLSDIAAGAQMDRDDARRILSNMADKGLLYAFEFRGTPMFMLFGVVWTIFKFPLMTNVPGLDYRRLIQLCDEYLAEGPLVDSTSAPVGKLLPMGRVLPIQESLPVGSETLPQDMVYKYIDGARSISVGECSCKKIVGGCGSPTEVCMAFDHEARFLVERKMARFIDRVEARSIHKKASDAGLVSVTSNTRDKVNLICHCCPCCCAQLGVATRHGLYDLAPRGAYIASVKQDDCTACGICVDVCPMKAIEVGEAARIDIERCIGCGLCVSTCADGALSMIKRTPPPDVPENVMELTKRAVEARGIAGEFMKELSVRKKGD